MSPLFDRLQISELRRGPLRRQEFPAWQLDHEEPHCTLHPRRSKPRVLSRFRILVAGVALSLRTDASGGGLLDSFDNRSGRRRSWRLGFALELKLRSTSDQNSSVD